MNHQVASLHRPKSKERRQETLKGILLAAFAGTLLLICIVVLFMFGWEAFYANESVALPTLVGISGEFLGGILGPGLSLVSIYLVVIALREQRETNAIARKSGDVESFKKRFFEMVKLHRDNVQEMVIGEIEGRKVFTKMLEEVRRALNATSKLRSNSEPKFSKVEQLQIAYLVVFFGVGPVSSPALLEAIEGTGIRFSQVDLVSLEMLLDRQHEDDDEYVFFDGHQQRLGHYYRHLFQSISQVNDQQLITDKSSYTKVLRAQLSTHEQLLLLVNSFTSLGWRWWKDGFMLKYCLVKNLPKGMIESLLPKEVYQLFPHGYFEWEASGDSPPILDSLLTPP